MAEQIGKFATAQVVHHGPGALSRLQGEIRRLGGERPVIVTDPGVVKAGIRDQVLQALEQSAPVWDSVEGEPRYTLVEECASFLRANQCDLVIGVGGGSSLDVAKMASALLVNEGSVADYFGVERLPKAGAPIIAIPTTAGTGSEVSPAAVFVDPRDERKVGVRSDFLLPRVAILDPMLTLSLPPSLTAATGVDALTHAIECYTAQRATILSDFFAERAITMIADNLPIAYSRGGDVEARNGMLLGSYLAGLTLSIANVGAVHALAQAMGGMFHVHHGVANALLLPHVMAFNRISCKVKYARVAELLGEPAEGLSWDEASTKAVEYVRRMTRELGIPQRLRELNIPWEALEKIAQSCMQTQTRVVTNNPRTMSLDDAREILRQAY